MGDSRRQRTAEKQDSPFSSSFILPVLSGDAMALPLISLLNYSPLLSIIYAEIQNESKINLMETSPLEM